MDLITALPETKDGHDAVVVFVDALTKMVHFRACRTDANAEAVARLFVDTVVRLHGIPGELLSDRDTRFISLKLSSSYHPQTDGQTERVNRVLEEFLRHYVSPEQNDWDRLLPMAEFAVNNAWHESVQNTPFFLNYGQHPMTPASVAIDFKSPAAADFTATLQSALTRAKQLLAEAQQRQKAYADRHRREVTLKVGDKVLLSTRNLQLKNKGTKKLLPKWVGPFDITQCVGSHRRSDGLGVDHDVVELF